MGAFDLLHVLCYNTYKKTQQDSVYPCDVYLFRSFCMWMDQGVL